VFVLLKEAPSARLQAHAVTVVKVGKMTVRVAERVREGERG
jgi:hypothetical protein